MCRCVLWNDGSCTKRCLSCHPLHYITFTQLYSNSFLLYSILLCFNPVISFLHPLAAYMNLPTFFPSFRSLPATSLMELVKGCFSSKLGWGSWRINARIMWHVTLAKLGPGGRIWKTNKISLWLHSRVTLSRLTVPQNNWKVYK